MGRAYAKALAQAGAHVVVNDVDGASAERVAAEISAALGRKAAVANDGNIASWEDCERLVRDCVETFGSIDVLVNNAGVFKPAPIWELSPENFQRHVGAHLTGSFACARFASGAMMKQGGGSIINVTSRAAEGQAGNSIYAALKAGVAGATASWALELAKHKVRVNAVSPAGGGRSAGFKPSKHFIWAMPNEPVNELPTPESVAPLVVYLASDASSWVTGQVIFLSGDTLALISHARARRFAFRPEGWTAEEIARHFKETIGASLEPLGMSAAPYPWYDGVR